VVLDGFDHDGVLELWFGYLHAASAPDACVRNVAISGYFVGGIDDYDPLLEVIGEHSGRFAQQRGLANSGPSHRQNALARFHKVANYVDGSVNSAPHPAGKSDDFADAISYRRNPVERPFDSSTIVPRESTDPARDVLNVFAANEGIGEIDGCAGIPRFGLAAQVKHGFDQ